MKILPDFVTKIFDVIEKVVPDGDLKRELKAQIVGKRMEYETELLDAKKEIITTETKRG